ncbi:MAG: lytic transglycosylase domain-containing protein [Candidatus Methylomirabilales bacterium]
MERRLQLAGRVLVSVLVLILGWTGNDPALQGVGRHTVWTWEPPNRLSEVVQSIHHYIASRNSESPILQDQRFPIFLIAASKARGVDFRLVLAVMAVESDFRPKARSSKGAMGLMQVKPLAAREAAAKLNLKYSRRRLYEPYFNVAVGIEYLRQQHERFEAIAPALVSYNQGPTRVAEQWPRWVNRGYYHKVATEFHAITLAIPDGSCCSTLGVFEYPLIVPQITPEDAPISFPRPSVSPAQI